MEFQRVGKHTVKCVISEEEIYDLGYSIGKWIYIIVKR